MGKLRIWSIFMINKNPNHFCRICGLDQHENPWGEDNNSPNFAICDCCGAEFGYNDVTITGIHNYRNQWIASSAKWFSPRNKPFNWSLEEQLKNIPEIYK